jgi:hypothetical protein
LVHLFIYFGTNIPTLLVFVLLATGSGFGRLGCKGGPFVVFTVFDCSGGLAGGNVMTGGGVGAVHSTHSTHFLHSTHGSHFLSVFRKWTIDIHKDTTNMLRIMIAIISEDIVFICMQRF